jgi:hypothetical protein
LQDRQTRNYDLDINLFRTFHYRAVKVWNGLYTDSDLKQVQSLKILKTEMLKPRLHDQFLCDKFSYFYVTNVFGRVDETTNNC